MRLLSVVAHIPRAKAFNVALAETEGERTFFRSRFSPSSPLPMEALHRGLLDQYVRPSDSLSVYCDALFVKRDALRRSGMHQALSR
jgi:hypothetical protein